MAEGQISNKEVAELVGVHQNNNLRWRLASESHKVDSSELTKLCNIINCELGQMIEWISSSRKAVS